MKFKKGPLVVIFLAIVALIILDIFVRYYGDWLWFENLGFAKVFTTILWAKALSFAAFALLFGIFAAVNIFIARRQGSLFPHGETRDPSESGHAPRADFSWGPRHLRVDAGSCAPVRFHGVRRVRLMDDFPAVSVSFTIWRY